MKKGTIVPVAAAALALVTLAAPAGADQVRLHGATTVIDRLIAPGKDAVEKSTGSTLEVVGNGTGKGLVDLHEGRCDAALSSEPLEIAVAAAAVAGKQVDRTKLQFAVISHDEIVFVVHPSNPVSSLTWEQIRDIHTGRIKNWKEVGGPDKPITLFADTPTGGTRALIKATVMENQAYSASTVSLTAVKKVADMVAADPTGFGGLGKGFVDSRVKTVQSKKLERPLGIVSIGPPTPAVKAVIDAYKKEASKK